MMSTDHTLTISSIVFHVDTTCLSSLNQYLEKVRRSDSATKEERLAELLLDKLKEEGKQIVTKAEFDFVIKAQNTCMPD